VTGPVGTDSESKVGYIHIDETAPVANFIANPTSGPSPLLVQFTDQSTGTLTSWSWNFGDGGTSTVQNPSYTYNSVGDFTVSLTATGPGGSDTDTKIGYIHIDETAPVANFIANPTSGPSPLLAQFTDQSTGTLTSWSWNFGDGGTSTVQNPSYTYNSVGDFTVSLTVTGPGGQDGETKTDYIDVTGSGSAPIIDKIRPLKNAPNPREPGTVLRIIGSGFGGEQGDSEVHIGPKTYGPGHRKIRRWSDTRIKVKLPKYKCEWFKGEDYRKRKIWVTVDSVDSNTKRTKVFKPDTCP
jgi:PKD repeat protein